MAALVQAADPRQYCTPVPAPQAARPRAVFPIPLASPVKPARGGLFDHASIRK